MDGKSHGSDHLDTNLFNPSQRPPLLSLGLPSPACLPPPACPAPIPPSLPVVSPVPVFIVPYVRSQVSIKTTRGD